jgi:uncharacterized membrane protein YjgN (DUF898 family)
MDAFTNDQTAAAPPLRYGFRFEGSGAEYFKIWIVNLALTVVTLGIFSAWAKVRSTRYFYGNTYVGDHSFDYHADPVRILIGRVIALAALVAYSVASAFAPLLSFAFFIALLIAMPWLIISALRFNARNSSYRNIRFGFDAEYGEAAHAYLLWPFLAAITLFTTYPLARRAQLHFNINHHNFGGKPFDCEISGPSIYKIYFKGMLLTFALLLIGFTAAFLFGRATGILSMKEVAPELFLPWMAMTFMFAGLFFVIVTYVATEVFNLAITRTSLALRYRFESTLSGIRVVWLLTSNLVLIFATLGLFYPWARVRAARYTVSCLAVTGPADMDSFTSELVAGQGAIGEEIASFFDVDVSL